jgi:hypothetical protein
MITEYELYSDERYQDSSSLLLGGVICTVQRRVKLASALNQVRSDKALAHEMRWTKISNKYCDAYKAWVDVFFDDSYSRFSLLKLDVSSPLWQSFHPRYDRRSTKDDKLASLFYQFLLVSFGPLRDTKRWWVYPDAGFFSKDTVLNRVEFLLNRTYKRAFGPKTSRIIRLARAQDSKYQDLIQLADVLLGAIGCDVSNRVPESSSRAELVRYCREQFSAAPKTTRGLTRLCVHDWQPPISLSIRGKEPGQKELAADNSSGGLELYAIDVAYAVIEVVSAPPRKASPAAGRRRGRLWRSAEMARATRPVFGRRYPPVGVVAFRRLTHGRNRVRDMRGGVRCREFPRLFRQEALSLLAPCAGQHSG